MSSLTIDFDELSSSDLSSSDEEMLDVPGQPVQYIQDPNENFLLLVLFGRLDELRQFYNNNQNVISQAAINTGFYNAATLDYITPNYAGPPANYYDRNRNVEFVRFFFDVVGINRINRRLIDEIVSTSFPEVRDYITAYFRKQLLARIYLNM